MTIFLLDSMTRVPAWAHHAAGSSGALRYSSHYTPKVITRGEYDYYRQNHLQVAVVFEDTADRALAGYDAGKADGEFSLKQQRAAGMPHANCGLWAADFDPAGHSYDACDAYADGWGAVWGRDNSGPYGGKGTVSRQAERGYRRLWQTYAWSGGQFDKRAQLYQYSNGHVIGGVGVDFNHAFTDDWGQWGYEAVKPKPQENPAYMIHPTSNPRKGGMIGGPFGPFLINGKHMHLDERATVEAYDDLRDQQGRIRHPHKKELAQLRQELMVLANRIYEKAHQDLGMPGWGIYLPPRWNVNHWGARYQALRKRADGEKVI